MKYLILSLFVTIGIYSQSEKKYIIEGTVDDCQTEYSEIIHNSFIRIKKENILIQDSIKLVSGYFKISDLTKGKYTLEYGNLFGQLISKKIELNKDITDLKLCVDEFIDNKTETLLERINKNDILELYVTNSGCFHFEKDKLKFYYRSDNLIAEYFKNGKRKKRITVNREKLNYLIQYERKVLQRSKRDISIFCTSSIGYIFKINDKEINNIFDNSCDWDGYYLMIEKIFNLK